MGMSAERRFLSAICCVRVVIKVYGGGHDIPTEGVVEKGEE